jgi:hypothetical protein
MQKYTEGQRVKIIGVRNQRKVSKYPELEKYISKIGIVTDGYWISNKPPNILRNQYIYKVRIDNDNSRITVSEDALIPYIEWKSQTRLTMLNPPL